MGLYPPPITKVEYDEILIENFGDFAPEVAATYPLSDYNTNFDAVEAVIGDYLFVCPAQYMIEAFNTPNTINKMSFMFLFNHTPSWFAPSMGPVHGSEINFVFGFRPEGETPFTPEEEIISRNMTYYWTDFAKFGNPNSFRDVTCWPRYTNSFHQRLVINTGASSYIPEYRASQCELWKEYYDLYGIAKPPMFMDEVYKYLR